MNAHYFFPPAAAYALNRCLFRLKSEPAYRSRFVADRGNQNAPANIQRIVCRRFFDLGRMHLHPEQTSCLGMRHFVI